VVWLVSMYVASFGLSDHRSFRRLVSPQGTEYESMTDDPFP